jgi:hypothetical protein
MDEDKKSTEQLMMEALMTTEVALMVACATTGLDPSQVLGMAMLNAGVRLLAGKPGDLKVFPREVILRSLLRLQEAYKMAAGEMTPEQARALWDAQDAQAAVDRTVSN